MIFFKFVFACFTAAGAAATTLHAEDEVLAALLKRQAPGTPSYNCHDNCGTAISLSRQPNKCDLDAFKANYNNCLQCAGPDNHNIWRMYGNTLSSTGSSCGFSTTPASGKQPEVGPAVHISSRAASATPAPLSASVASIVATSTSAAASAPTNPNLFPTSVSNVPAASRNTTASFTSSAPPQQSENAATQLGHAGILGVIVGLMAGL